MVRPSAAPRSSPLRLSQISAPVSAPNAESPRPPEPPVPPEWVASGDASPSPSPPHAPSAVTVPTMTRSSTERAVTLCMERNILNTGSARREFRSYDHVIQRSTWRYWPQPGTCWPKSGSAGSPSTPSLRARRSADPPCTADGPRRSTLRWRRSRAASITPRGSPAVRRSRRIPARFRGDLTALVSRLVLGFSAMAAHGVMGGIAAEMATNQEFAKGVRTRWLDPDQQVLAEVFRRATALGKRATTSTAQRSWASSPAQCSTGWFSSTSRVRRPGRRRSSTPSFAASRHTTD